MFQKLRKENLSSPPQALPKEIDISFVFMLSYIKCRSLLFQDAASYENTSQGANILLETFNVTSGNIIAWASV